MTAAATTEPTALSRSPSLPTFFDNLNSFDEAPEGEAKLRESVLDLAVRGKLVEQDENDEPVPVLFELRDPLHARFDLRIRVVTSNRVSLLRGSR